MRIFCMGIARGGTFALANSLAIPHELYLERLLSDYRQWDALTEHERDGRIKDRDILIGGTGESNPYLIFMLPDYLRVFPYSLFIFVIRDKKDWLESLRRTIFEEGHIDNSGLFAWVTEHFTIQRLHGKRDDFESCAMAYYNYFIDREKLCTASRKIILKTKHLSKFSTRKKIAELLDISPEQIRHIARGQM